MIDAEVVSSVPTDCLVLHSDLLLPGGTRNHRSVSTKAGRRGHDQEMGAGGHCRHGRSE
jgi:hypothetical protein